MSWAEVCVNFFVRPVLRLPCCYHAFCDFSWATLRDGVVVCAMWDLGAMFILRASNLKSISQSQFVQ